MDSIMNKVSLWISTMRLRTLPLSISGIILASCLAEYNGYFKWKIGILAILTTLSFQILSNLANDYGDGIKGTDNNGRIGPERAIQSGKISPDEMFNAIKINVLISIGLAFLLIFCAFGVKHFLLTLLFFILGIASVVGAIKYTVGSNAYGYRGLGDLFVFVFFGLVSVIGCYVLYAKTIDHVVFLPACTVGLLSVGVLNLNNMRDIVSDEKSNKLTLAVKFGIKNARIYHYALIGLAILLSALFGILYYTSPYNLIFMVAYIPLLIHIKKVSINKEPKLLDPELKKIALTTVLLAILMGVGHLL
ncbi:1,4-dihydroxy-2-naphthoate octaprenyltransferase [Flavivirga spongiicola]|uniref:1,4-dihydroxy-2-naphthoate octaprenyltransferase n=2 Tax=Flavivirga spongiicola TaxID=421621 RepID=A0ABU7XX51_9FLAO|nr:1,4-dihydroxy-2-naphthoate octaprenyltransferase [Flavivirga sp. MEBiC05379]MDO5980361.1 1,4-dihydroxy-2-naphthoate octaprenyltransferase [Flavivirga sp. MEBiC05379]